MGVTQDDYDRIAIVFTDMILSGYGIAVDDPMEIYVSDKKRFALTMEKFAKDYKSNISEKEGD